jgi:hypothetical protein
MSKKERNIITIEADENHLPVPTQEDLACLDEAFAAGDSQIDYSDIPYSPPKNAYRPGRTEHRPHPSSDDPCEAMQH